jgi:hypothetical protein
VFPPLKKKGMADQFEPRSKLKSRIVEHRLQSIRCNIPGVADLVGVWFEINIFLDEEDIVN